MPEGAPVTDIVVSKGSDLCIKWHQRRRRVWTGWCRKQSICWCFVSGTTECLLSNQADDYLRTKPQSRRLGRSSWLFIIKNIEFVQMKNKAWPDGLKAVIFFFLTLSYCLLTVSLSLIGPYWTFTRPSWHLITDGLTNLLLLIRLLSQPMQRNYCNYDENK